MELFTITCTTCKSRLKVRDQAAIGQILACPKCGGMVMVKPPPAFQEVSDQRSDLPTATELSTPLGPKFNQTLDSSAFDVVDDLLSDAPPKVQPPAAASAPSATPPPAAKPRFVGGPKAGRGAANSATQPAGRSTGELSPIPPPAPQAPTPAEPLVPRRGPHWVLIAGSIVLGIAMAFAAVAMTISTLRGSRGPVKSGQSVSREAEGASGKSPDSDVAQAPEPVETATAENAPSQAADAPVPVVVSESASPAVAANGGLPNAATDGSETTSPSATVLPVPPVPAASAASPAPAGSGLEKFDRLLAGGSDDPLAPATAPMAASTPVPMDAEPAKPLAPRPPPRDVDVSKRLADPILGIETAGTPLADFVQLISDLSTIPMTLDLPLTPATAESQVTLKLASTTVGAALQQALAPLRLEYVVVEGQLVIRRIEPEVFEPTSRAVKDLTGGDEGELAELADLLRSTIEPEAWKEETGGSLTVDASKGSLILTQKRSVQLQVLIALEKLRAARRPPLPHVLKLDPALYQATTRYAQAAGNLEKSVSLNFSQPTRLLTILERLGEATGTRIVVDWRDVAAAGWNPAAEAKLLVSGKTLTEALDALLDPLDLAWRVIDATTIQVVTPTKLMSQGEFELYPVESLVAGSGGDELVQRIRTALAKAITDESGGEIRFDPQTRCILAWLPQPHQQALELLLTQRKAEGAK